MDAETQAVVARLREWIDSEYPQDFEWLGPGRDPCGDATRVLAALAEAEREATEWIERVGRPIAERDPLYRGTRIYRTDTTARLAGILAAAAGLREERDALREELRLVRIEWESACERDRAANALRAQAEEERDIALRVQIAMADGAKRSAESAEARAQALAKENARLRAALEEIAGKQARDPGQWDGVDGHAGDAHDHGSDGAYWACGEIARAALAATASAPPAPDTPKEAQ